MDGWLAGAGGRAASGWCSAAQQRRRLPLSPGAGCTSERGNKRCGRPANSPLRLRRRCRRLRCIPHLRPQQQARLLLLLLLLLLGRSALLPLPLTLLLLLLLVLVLLRACCTLRLLLLLFFRLLPLLPCAVRGGGCGGLGSRRRGPSLASRLAALGRWLEALATERAHKHLRQWGRGGTRATECRTEAAQRAVLQTTQQPRCALSTDTTCSQRLHRLTLPLRVAGSTTLGRGPAGLELRWLRPAGGAPEASASAAVLAELGRTSCRPGAPLQAAPAPLSQQQAPCLRRTHWAPCERAARRRAPARRQSGRRPPARGAGRRGPTPAAPPPRPPCEQGWGAPALAAVEASLMPERRPA